MSPLHPKLHRARYVSEALLGHAQPVQADVALKPKETCWFRTAATLYEERTYRKYVSGSRGVSIRIMKGVSYRVGSTRGYSVPVSEVVAICPGTFYITNQRCMFVGARKTVTVQVKDLISFDAFDDGIQLHHERSSKFQVFKFPDGEYAAAVLSGLLNPIVASAAIDVPTPQQHPSPPPIAVARERASQDRGIGYRALQVITVAALVLFGPIGILLAWWQRFWSLRTRVVGSIASAAFFVFVLSRGGDRGKTAHADTAAPTGGPTVPEFSALPSIQRRGGAKPDRRWSMPSERSYVSAAEAYLEAVDRSDEDLSAMIMAVHDQKSTTDDLRTTIVRTRAAQTDAFASAFSPLSPPTTLAAPYKEIQKCKLLHDAAFEEALEFWNDSNPDHVAKANGALARAVIAANEAVAGLDRTVNDLISRRRAASAAKAKAHALPATPSGSGSASAGLGPASDSAGEPLDPYR